MKTNSNYLEKARAEEKFEADIVNGSTWNVEHLQRLAKVQKVHNEDIFGPVKRETVVIAIQGFIHLNFALNGCNLNHNFN